MRLHPIKSIILGAVIAITLLGISALVFYNSLAFGILNFAAPIIGGFIATYFTIKPMARYGACAGIISAAAFVTFEFILGNIGLETIPFMFISSSFIFGVIAGLSGITGEIISNSGPIGKKVNKIMRGNRVIYCPQCGLKNWNSKLCRSCGENLETGKKYLKISSYKLIGFYVVLLAMAVTYFSGYYNQYYWPFTVFFFICFAILAVYEHEPDLRNKARLTLKYCPACENEKYNNKYCIKCGYNIENVVRCFKTGDNDIEMNRNYIRIYPKIYLEHNDGMPSRLAPKTFTLDKIENLRLSSCETLLSNKPCLIFDYLDKKCERPAVKERGNCIVKIKIEKKDEIKMNKILNTGIYDG